MTPLSPVRALTPRFVGVALLWAIGACASTTADEPLRAPALEVRTFVRGGAPLGPTLGVDAVRAEKAARWSVRAVWLERMPEFGEALSSRTQLVEARRGETPFVPTSPLFDRVRVGQGDEVLEFERRLAGGAFGRTVELGTFEAALLVGATTQTSLRADEVSSDAASIRVELARAESGFSLCVGRDGSVREVDVEGVARVVQRSDEALLDLAPQSEGEACVLVFEAPFEPSEARALAMVLAVHSTAAPELVARALEDCGRAQANARQRPEWLDTARAREQQIALALRALEAGSEQRAALVFLAQACEAPLCGDVALLTDELVLAEYVEALSAELKANSDVGERTLQWTFERGTALFLARRGNSQTLERELVAVLARHTGELGRTPSALEYVARASRDLADFQTRVADENLIFLEDGHPGARVRAFDWLASRGLAPEDFDPLSSAESRQSALERFEGSRERR